MKLITILSMFFLSFVIFGDSINQEDIKNSNNDKIDIENEKKEEIKKERQQERRDEKRRKIRKSGPGCKI